MRFAIAGHYFTVLYSPWPQHRNVPRFPGGGEYLMKTKDESHKDSKINENITGRRSETKVGRSRFLLDFGVLVFGLVNFVF